MLLQRVEAMSRPPQKTKTEETLNFIKCPVCDHEERITAMHCSQCGIILRRAPHKEHTQKLVDNPMSKQGDAEYFDDDATLLLKIHGEITTDYRIRPQDKRDYIVIGRQSSQQGAVDIDLTDNDGHTLGVSRRHLAIIYDRVNHVLNVTDLGSGNGTFINAQRLHAHELRVLRDGDILRLGHLEITATILHNEKSSDSDNL